MKKYLSRFVSLVAVLSLFISSASVLLIPKTAGAVATTYNITGSAVVSSPSVTVTGTATVTDPNGPGDYHVSVDWDSSGTWECIVNCTPTTGQDFSGTNPLTVDYTAAHTYSSGGTKTIKIVVHHAGVQGNESGSSLVTLTVDIVANTPPVITVVGSNPTTLTVGDTYTESGATALDTEDGDLTSSIVTTGSVNTAVAGTYTITYTVSDLGVPALTDTKTRTVIVNPVVPPTNTPPVITVLGSNPTTITVGGTYTESGATALDTEDGDLTSSIITTGTVNTAVVGTYIITYTVTDSGSLTDTKTRTVNVVAASSSSGSGSGSGHGTGPAIHPQVLGASICGVRLDKYLRRGYSNNPVAVKALQEFLNEFMSANLTVSGVFDAKTEQYVKMFQNKYATDILRPWDKTLSNGKKQQATGIVYLLTTYQINKLSCPEFNEPVPTNLIQWSKNPNLKM